MGHKISIYTSSHINSVFLLGTSVTFNDAIGTCKMTEFFVSFCKLDIKLTNQKYMVDFADWLDDETVLYLKYHTTLSLIKHVIII